MKVFALLVLLFLCAFLVVVKCDYDDELERCIKCFDEPKNLVCGKGHITSTYYNECLCICENAVILHAGECTDDDLINNQHKQF